MELNKQENTQTNEFVNFSIREYVAEIRKKDRRKCWPFGSLGDPYKYDVFASYQSVESSILSSQNCPSDHIDGLDDKSEQKEVSNLSKIETFNGNEDQSQTTNMIESLEIDDNLCKRININGYPDSNSCKVIYETKKRPEISVSGSDDNDEPGRNPPKRKHKRVRLLSDILRDLDNVNNKFTTETEDELDDITLDAISKKQKGLEVTTMSKKKMMTNCVEEPRFEKEEKSNCESKLSNGIDSDLVTVIHSMQTIRCTEVSRTEPTETGNEDSEMEAVMLLANHFNEENPSSPGARKAQTDQSNMEVISNLISSSSSENQLFEFGKNQGFPMGTNCACIQKKMRTNLTNESIPMFNTRTFIKEPTIYGPKLTEHRASKARVFENNVPIVCSINRNPADFSIPNAENVFMRGGGGF